MDQSPLLLITIAGMIINQLYNIKRDLVNTGNPKK